MDKENKIQGVWWLPETPEKEVPGTLSFSPGERIILELMGNLSSTDDRNLISQDFMNPSIIHGISVQGKPITLQKCMQTGRKNSSEGISTTTFLSHLAFVGVHFPSNEQVEFKGLSVSFQNLDEWFHKYAFDIQHPKPGSEIVIYKQPNPVKTIIRDFHIDFVLIGPNMSFDFFRSVLLFQEARINIWSDVNRSMDAFFPILRHIQNFLTLAMSKPTFVVKVIGSTEFAMEESPRIYQPVDIYYPAAEWQSQTSKVHYFDMLFNLPDIEDQIEIILGKWIEKAEIIKPVYDLYFSALYNPATYPEFNFLSLVQAIETYHRQIFGGKYQPDTEFLLGVYKSLVAAIPGDIADDFRTSLQNGKLRFANEYSLRKRLLLLGEHIAEHMNILYLENKDKRRIFAEKVTDTRNYLTHYTPELKDKAATGGQELYDIILKLRLILQICFLEILGFPFKNISDILKKSQDYHQILRD